MKKKQKIKRKILLNLILSFFVTLPIVYGADVLGEQLGKQNGPADGFSQVTVSNEVSRITEYINAGNNSTIIGNYFAGYYYDNVFGYFRLDWSTDKDKNVHVIGSTDKCATGYGYKLGGKAQSYNGGGGYNTAGYIDFNYSSTIFVYYCESDNKLHGKAYSKEVGYQDFEGIGFQILASGNTNFDNTGTGIFVNDKSEIDAIEIFTGSTSNVSIDEILGEEFKFDTSQESIFYIVK